MKKMILAVSLLVILVGCNASEEVKARRLAQKYLQTFYDTTELDLEYRCVKVECSFDNEIYKLDRIDSIVTEEFKNAILKNRRISILYRLSYDFDTRIKLSDYTLTSEEFTDNSVTISYVIDVELIEYDEIIKGIEGQLTINKVNEEWVVGSETNSAKKYFAEFITNKEN